MDLLQSRTRVAALKSTGSAAGGGGGGKTTSKERRNQRRAADRVRKEEEEERRQANWGGFGEAATVGGALSVLPPRPTAVMPMPVSVPVQTGGGAGAAEGGKGKAVLALEGAFSSLTLPLPITDLPLITAHCSSHALSVPVFTHSTSEGQKRLSVVVKDLRFELPPKQLPENGREAEEKLAVKVLRHLQKMALQGGGGGA
jgi:hypothetical protein